jgi:hypothetical protein
MSRGVVTSSVSRDGVPSVVLGLSPLLLSSSSSDTHQKQQLGLLHALGGGDGIIVGLFGGAVESTAIGCWRMPVFEIHLASAVCAVDDSVSSNTARFYTLDSFARQQWVKVCEGRPKSNLLPPTVSDHVLRGAVWMLPVRLRFG